MEILSQQGGWFWLLAPLLAASFALLLYFYKKQYENSTQRWILAGLRFSIVLLLILLLGEFYLKTEKKIVEKPQLAVVFDNSSSLLHQTDSTALASQLVSLKRDLEDGLNEKANLRFYSFGEALRDSLSFDFGEAATDFGLSFEQLGDRLGGQALAAVVVVSDGIQNRGGNAVRAAEKLGVPVYTVALGDTTVSRDLRIQALRANALVYVQSDFNLLVDVAASRLAGQTVILELEKFEKNDLVKLGTQTLVLRGEQSFGTAAFTIPAGQPGLNRYRVTARTTGEDPTMLYNNQRDIYVEVVDTRTKILILAHGPHPDLGILQRTLGANPRYESTLSFSTQSPQAVSKPDLIIAHQLPSLASNSAAWMAQVKRWELPVWYIVGSQTHLFAFNQQQNLIQINSRSGGTNKVQGVVVPDFSLFTPDPAWANALSNLPPLDAPFGEYQMSGQAQALLHQRMGSVSTGIPLLAFSPETPRTAVFSAEGLWKWGLASAESGQAEALWLEELIRKTIQFLSVTTDKSPFKLRTSKKLFEEQEDVLFDAELLNAANEAINEPEVRLMVKSSQGQQFNFVLGRNRQHYYLNAGALPPGDYTFEGEVQLGGKKLLSKGSFAVVALNLEKINTVANHGLLAQIAASTGGKAIYPAQITELLNALQVQEGMVSQSFYEQRLESLIDLSWLLVLLILLLTAEWMLRRYWGLL